MKLGYFTGINYKGTASELSGCINDTQNLEKFFSPFLDEVSLITDENTLSWYTTAKGMVQMLTDVALDSWVRNPSFVVLTYSGHGYYRADHKDESDGRDELLVPSDYQQSGFLSDDAIRELLAKFNPETQVLLLIDACHSGTCADLMYSYPDQRTRITCNEKQIPASVVSISGCLDKEVSSDAFNFSNQGKYSGAMTSAFLEVMNEDMTLATDAHALVQKMRALLKSKGYDQQPLLSASYDMDHWGSQLNFVQ